MEKRLYWVGMGGCRHTASVRRVLRLKKHLRLWLTPRIAPPLSQEDSLLKGQHALPRGYLLTRPLTCFLSLSSSSFFWASSVLRCEENAGNSFPNTQGKDPSSRASRRKRGHSGYGRDSRIPLEWRRVYRLFFLTRALIPALLWENLN